MASTDSLEYAKYLANKQTFDAGMWRRELVCFKAKVLFAAQAAADTSNLFVLPKGFRFAFGTLAASATLGASATIALGIAGTPAKYRAAAVHTTADLPILFGKAAAMDVPLQAEETIIATYAVASLPSASGSDYYIAKMFGTIWPFNGL